MSQNCNQNPVAFVTRFFYSVGSAGGRNPEPVRHVITTPKGDFS